MKYVTFIQDASQNRWSVPSNVQWWNGSTHPILAIFQRGKPCLSCTFCCHWHCSFQLSLSVCSCGRHTMDNSMTWIRRVCGCYKMTTSARSSVKKLIQSPIDFCLQRHILLWIVQKCRLHTQNTPKRYSNAVLLRFWEPNRSWTTVQPLFQCSKDPRTTFRAYVENKIPLGSPSRDDLQSKSMRRRRLYTISNSKSLLDHRLKPFSLQSPGRTVVYEWFPARSRD